MKLRDILTIQEDDGGAAGATAGATTSADIATVAYPLFVRGKTRKEKRRNARRAVGQSNTAGPTGVGTGVYENTQGVAEGKVKLYTDPNHFGAEIDDTGFDSLGIVDIPANQLVGFEPDAKMNQPKSKANVEKIVAGLKQGEIGRAS